MEIPIEEGRAASKSPYKNLAIFLSICLGKQFLTISFQIQLLHFTPKEKELRHKQLGYTDQLVTHKFRSLAILVQLTTLKSSNS
jgi:hypothetical protein